MRTIISITSICLSIASLAGCSQPHTLPQASASKTQVSSTQPPFEPLISPVSPAYSNVVAVADRLVSGAGLKWGEPTEIRWQPDPLNPYVVIYATPQSELGYAGYRGVHVATNGDVWFVPRE
jgi:hypothetical protein